MAKRKRRTYTTEFKLEPVRLCTSMTAAPGEQVPRDHPARYSHSSVDLTSGIVHPAMRGRVDVNGSSSTPRHTDLSSADLP